MTPTMKFTGELRIISCWCGIHMAVPSGLREYQIRQRDDGQEFAIYCPLGHRFVLAGRSKVDIERERAEQARAAVEAARDQLEMEKRAHAATKGKLTKTRNRVAKGVCPCCNRSFVQLERHMRTRHPEFPTGADRQGKAT